MNLRDSVYIGIDPTSGNNDFHYAVLDGDLNLIALADADMDELVTFLEGQESAFVAINSPSGVNQGLVKKLLVEGKSSPGRSIRGADIRLAEYELRERGITVTGTPARVEFCPAWMRVGFGLYERLVQIGFKPYNSDKEGCQFLETHPYACFCVLVESIPFPKPSLEGRLQRQLILNDKGLLINDGMVFFEEITRFKLIRGILPLEVLYIPEQLDALVAAYTAWLSVQRPEDVTRVGNRDEGQITLPVKELKARY